MKMHTLYEKVRNDYGFPDVKDTSASVSKLSTVSDRVFLQTTCPQVVILLCIYEGKNFLADQLESIAQQSYKNWKLYISDDGDCRESIELIKKFKSRYKEEQIVFITGPQKGFVANFLSLICNKSIDADYFAFSDQDDIWHKNKLEKSIQCLSEVSKELPSLYCSRTVIVDKNDSTIGLSPLFLKTPSFANALVQNIGGGNTMVFNKKLREIAFQAGPNIPAITHDWWMYLLVTGCNGFIKYDSEPSLRYRQHGKNLVGCNITWRARFYRIFMLFRGRFKDWNEKNLTSLQRIYHLLTPANQQLFDDFSKLRNAPFFERLRIFKKSKIYRQTIFGNLGLWVAICLRKM
jgi:glycosyltransferase involved in cell wall biosynthesis